MANYSVATTKDKLSSLIDKALAGEEVIITRHGKPVVALHIVKGTPPPQKDVKSAMAWLRAQREQLPISSISSLDLKRLEENEYER